MNPNRLQVVLVVACLALLGWATSHSDRMYADDTAQRSANGVRVDIGDQIDRLNDTMNQVLGVLRAIHQDPAAGEREQILQGLNDIRMLVESLPRMMHQEQSINLPMDTEQIRRTNIGERVRQQNLVLERYLYDARLSGITGDSGGVYGGIQPDVSGPRESGEREIP